MDVLDVKPEQIELYKLVVCVTSDPDYDMSRVLMWENYPDWDHYTIATGGHCSCYGFDDCHWDVISYTKEEILKLLEAWENSWGAEPLAVPLIRRYLNG